MVSDFIMTRTQINYEDGTKFLSYHGNHGYYFPFIDQKMEIMSKRGPFDQWLREKYTTDEIEVRESDIVIDCGSFVGAFSVASAGMGAKKVYAIEPSSRNFNCIKKNIDHFSLEKLIEPINAGLGSSRSKLKLNLSQFSCEDSFLKCDEGYTGNQEEVDVFTVRDIVEKYNIDPNNLYLKVEAEGFEPEIISGMGDLKPRVIVIDNSAERNGERPEEAIKETLKNHGYQFLRTRRCLFAY